MVLAKMNSDSIITAKNPNDVFGSTLGAEALEQHATALKNLISKTDPNYGEAIKKIEDFKKKLDYPVAKIEKGQLRTRKSPYQVISPRRELTDNVVVHDVINKKNSKLMMSFASRPQMNSLISKGNSHIELVRASVTKRNRVFFPEIIDTVYIDTGKNSKLLATVQDIQGGETLNKLATGTTFTDQEIIKIYTTMLETLQKVHNAGLIHGACYLNAWTYNRETEAMVLKDWQYSIKEDELLQMRSSEVIEKGLYLDKTLQQGKVTTETDLRLASYAAHALTSDMNSPWLRKFIKGMGDFTSDNSKTIIKELNETVRINS